MFAMQRLSICVIATIFGAVAGVVQWRLFMKNPSLKKTINRHLDDVRFHWQIAVLGIISISACLTLIYEWRDVLKCVPMSFTLSWGSVIFLLGWRFMSTVPPDPAADIESQEIAQQLIQAREKH